MSNKKQIRLPTKSEVCDIHDFLNQLGDDIACPKCKATATSTSAFHIFIKDIEMLITARWIEQRQSNKWLPNHIHIYEGTIDTIRCTNCNYVDDADKFHRDTNQNIENLKCKVLSISDKWTTVQIKEKILTVPTSNVLRGIKVKDDAVIIGIHYSDFENKDIIEDSHVLIIKE